MTFVPGRSQKSFFLVLVSSINDKLLLDGGGLNNCSRKLGPAFSFLSCSSASSAATLLIGCSRGVTPGSIRKPTIVLARHPRPSVTSNRIWHCDDGQLERSRAAAAIQAQSSSQAGTFIKCPKMSKSAKMLAKMSGFFNWTSEDDLFFLVLSFWHIIFFQEWTLKLYIWISF